MNLPIDEKELDDIIKILYQTGKFKLHNKLWTFKFNYLNKKTEKN